MNEQFDNTKDNAVPEQSTQSPTEQTQPQQPTGSYEYKPNYNPNMNGAYGNSNQYMPYSSYMPNVKPEAEKVPSKNKKRGAFTAGIIVACCVLVAVVSMAVVLMKGEYTPQKQEESAGGEAQLEFVTTPQAENTSGTEMTPGDVYKKVYESSVGVLTYSGSYNKKVGEGSGIVMSVDGDKTYVITCAHVIEYSNVKIVVQDHDGNQYDATVLGMDSKTDIGVLCVETTELKAAEFANSDNLAVGDTVYAIGNPGGTQFFGSFTNGMVSAIGRPVNSPVGYEVACIQHTAAINPGNSGGALVNAYGQVIGINSSKIASTEYEGMGFAVPTSIVQEIVNQIVSNGKVDRAALGITYYFATTDRNYISAVRNNDLPAGTIVISEIRQGSDMKNTKAKVGDMIVAVNGEDADTTDALSDVIQNGKVGDTLTLTVARLNDDGTVEEFDISVKLVSETVLASE